VPGDVEAEAACDVLERQFERVVGKRFDLAAVVADEVVVVIASGVSGLVAGDAVADVDPLDEAEVGEAVEHAVDARDPDAPALGADPVMDLLRRAAAGLAAEVLDDAPPGAAAAVSRRPQRGQGMLTPGGRHVVDDNGSHLWYARRRMPARIILIFAALTVLAAGCSSESDDGRTDVVAGFYPLAYAAEQIGGAEVRVTNLTPAGVEPHDLEPTARDVEDLRDADLVLYARGLQPALERAVEGQEDRMLDVRAGDSGLDPHVWLDPIRFSSIARAIGGRVGRPEPARDFVARLAALDREFRSGLARCERREIVTAHAAFGRLAARYDLRQISLAGLSPEAEPTPRELERLVEAVRATGATTVFTEPLVSPRVADTVARETGARTAVLDPIEGLTEEQVARGDDYFLVMRRNLATLRVALGCR
jgi:zinc transport system substrate-binding protein